MRGSKSCFPVVLMIGGIGAISYYWMHNSYLISHNILIEYLLAGVLLLLAVGLLFYLIT
ncbi:MAG TPA: hypothetical protein VKY74_18120 [Chloroflexia bacterium]|nr:hypothetical protein [Chloroflexia bacterium]